MGNQGGQTHYGRTPASTDSSVAAELGADGQESIDRGVLELDHVFEALANRRRRHLVYALAGRPEWSLAELASRLVARERGGDDVEADAIDANTDAIDDDAHERMWVNLYHTHVPKLVDANVVDFDADTETVTRGSRAADAIAVLSGASTALDDATSPACGG